MNRLALAASRKGCIFVALLSVAVITEGCSPSQPTKELLPPKPLLGDHVKPNVVWILLDACRVKNLSPYGYGRNTAPNLDRLARRGVLCEENFAQSSMTSHSVPSYMTGRYFPVSSLYMPGKVPLKRRPPPGEVLAPEIFRQNGYRTVMVSAHRVFLGRSCPLWDAFDESVVVDIADPKQILASMADINREVFPRLRTDIKEPFFLYLHSVDTHMPHILDPPYDRWVDPAYSSDHLDGDAFRQAVWRRDGKPFTKADRDNFTALEDGSVSFVDAQIGLLLDRLEADGLLDNTIILVSSDHGDGLGEDGFTVGHPVWMVRDEVLHVPLIMAGPGIPEGVRIQSLTENVDILPTLIELLGLESTARPHGQSLVRLMYDPKASPLHDFAFAWVAPEKLDPAALYDGFRALSMRSTTFNYYYDPTSGLEHLWKVPNHLGKSEDLIKRYSKTAATMRTRLLADRMGYLQSYLDLPFDEIVLESTHIARMAESKDDFVWWDHLKRISKLKNDFVWWDWGGISLTDAKANENLYRDNKWSCNEGFLWSCAWQEDAPQIHFDFPLPNGKYRAEIWLLSTQDLHGASASSIRLKIENDASFRTVSTSPSPSDPATFVPVDLGEYTISDGMLNLVLDDADNGDWTYFNRIRLFPVSGDEYKGEEKSSETIQEKLEREELMKALGYLQ